MDGVKQYTLWTKPASEWNFPEVPPMTPEQEIEFAKRLAKSIEEGKPDLERKLAPFRGNSYFL